MRTDHFAQQIQLWAGLHSRIRYCLHHLYRCGQKYRTRINQPNVCMELINALMNIQRKAMSNEPSINQSYFDSMTIYLELDQSLSYLHTKISDLMVLDANTNAVLEYVLPR